MISMRLNESLANRYGDAGNQSMIRKALHTNQLSEKLQIGVKESFHSECCVVFSDISGFSTRTHKAKAREIKTFLDAYYAHVIPIIYEHGGLIDQMVGDGIVSVFSQELSPEITDDVFSVGLHAAMEIVETFAGSSRFSTKCALHKEWAVVCQLGDDNYRQATIVGEIMTIVHRLESAAHDEAVNMLYSLPEAGKLFKEVRARSDRLRSPNPEWIVNTFLARLKGVGSNHHQIVYWRYNW